jgi:hypothetical protein
MDSVDFILILIIIFVLLFNLFLYYDNGNSNRHNNSIILYEGLDNSLKSLKWWYMPGYCEYASNWSNIAAWIRMAQEKATKTGTAFNFDNLSTITNNFLVGENSRYNYPSGKGKPDDVFSVLIQGYFVPNVDGQWNFYTYSDDCSYVWIGKALQDINVDNAVVDNGGLHGPRGRTGSIKLNKDKIYPITIIMGERGGQYELQLQIQPPNGSWTTNGSGYFYTDPPIVGDPITYIATQTQLSDKYIPVTGPN